MKVKSTKMLYWNASLWILSAVPDLTVLVSLAANMILSAVGAETEWFLFVPYAIPARIVCPFFKMHANGIPLESSSPLLSGRVVFPALIIRLIFAFVILWGSSYAALFPASFGISIGVIGSSLSALLQTGLGTGLWYVIPYGLEGTLCRKCFGIPVQFASCGKSRNTNRDYFLCSRYLWYKLIIWEMR